MTWRLTLYAGVVGALCAAIWPFGQAIAISVGIVILVNIVGTALDELTE